VDWYNKAYLLTMHKFLDQIRNRSKTLLLCCEDLQMWEPFWTGFEAAAETPEKRKRYQQPNGNAGSDLPEDVAKMVAQLKKATHVTKKGKGKGRDKYKPKTSWVQKDKSWWKGDDRSDKKLWKPSKGNGKSKGGKGDKGWKKW